LPLGRIDQAVEQLRIAERNDPLSPYVHLWLGEALADAGRNEEAIVACEKAKPNPNWRACVLGARVRQGHAPEVIKLYEADPFRPRVAAALGCAYARAGRREDAERAFAASTDISRAEIPACLGDKDRVFEALNQDIAVGPIRMGWTMNSVDRWSPGLLRGDPQLKALRRKVGLPE
jgi:tetratricopeptide (TPR) repeat protein